MAVYAVSDLHGRYDVFERGLKEIRFSENDRLYMIGDAIDRGKDGIRILEYLMDHENTDLILGNHEFLMLNSVDPSGRNICNGHDSELWLYYNGGDRTFVNYAKLSEQKRKDMLDWLRSRYVIMTLNVGGREFCLTHSYFIEGLENMRYSETDYEDVWNIVWRSVYREERETHGEDIYGGYDYTFITGHVPVQRVTYINGREEFDIYVKGNLVDIDGGCSYGYYPDIENGGLFLRLDDMKVFKIPILS